MITDSGGPFVVALTGGIASGKTAVSDRFAARGVPVIDMDVIAHEIVRPGQPALEAIRSAFGNEFIGADGSLDRRKMREAVFSDPELKRRLESILHPAIRNEAGRRLLAVTRPWCLLVIPLLAEAGQYPGIHRILVVDTEESVQVERVMARDGIDRKQAEAILRSQADRRRRLDLADDVIRNDGSLEALESAVDSLFRKYERLAAAHAENQS